jgi:hypothetical protein
MRLSQWLLWWMASAFSLTDGLVFFSLYEKPLNFYFFVEASI